MAAASYFVLSGEKNNFKELAKQLNRQRKAGNLCDVTLIVKGQEVKAHRAVLSARSAYFHSMFVGNFIEKSQNKIDFTTLFTGIESLQSLVTYMYTGKLRLSWDGLEEVLHAAALFLLDEACQLCSQFMLQNASLQNCLHLWALAEQYSLTKLAKFCQTLAVTRFHDFLIHEPETLDLNAGFLKRMLTKDNSEVFHYVSYCDFLSFIIKWIKHQSENRVYEIYDLLHSETVLTRYALLRNIVNDPAFQDEPVECLEKEVLSKASCSLSSTEESGVRSGRASVTFHMDEEALLLQTVHGSAVGKPVLQLFAYTHRTQKWWAFSPLKLDESHFYDDLIVGFLNGCLVMRKKGDAEGSEEVYMIDIRTSAITDLPICSGAEDCEHNRVYFIFRDTLMFGDFVINDSEESNQFKLVVYAYDGHAKQWKAFYEQSMPYIQELGGRYFRVNTEAIVQNDMVYLCMYYEYSIDQDVLAELIALDIHVFSVTNVADVFLVQNVGYERDVHAMEENAADFVCAGANDGLYFTEVSRSDWYLEDTSVSIHDSELFYSKSTVKWHTRKHEKSLLPAIDIPLHLHPKYTGLCVLRGSQEKGLIYQTRRICPFISELWKFDVKQRSWSKLKPPPYDSELLKVETCPVPVEILQQLEVAHYQDTTEKRQRSPLYIYKLSGTKATIVKSKGESIDETDEEDDMYDKDCRLEEDWLQPTPSTSGLCQFRNANWHSDLDEDSINEL